jgi:hypothetical protein
MDDPWLRFAIHCGHCGRVVPITPDLEAQFRTRTGLSDADRFKLLSEVIPKLRCSACGARSAAVTPSSGAAVAAEAPVLHRRDVLHGAEPIQTARFQETAGTQTSYSLAIGRLIAAAMLLGALAPNAFGYYTLLRWVVSCVAIVTAVAFSGTKKQGWVWTFGIVAAVFNPLIPLGLDRGTWAAVDTAAAALMFVSIGILPKVPSSSG